MKQDPVDLNALRAFVEVVNERSFSHAASKLGVSVATMSRWIQDLEASRNCLLFSKRKPVTLSPVGRRYYDSLKGLIDEVQEVALALDDEVMRIEGEVRVLAPIHFSHVILGDLLIDFALAYPDIELSVRLSDDGKEIDTSGADVAFVIGQTLPDDWVTREFAISPLLLCAAADYIEQHDQPRSVEDMANHDLVVNTNNPIWHLSKGMEEKTFTPSPRFRVKEMEMTKRAVLAGLGIGNLPQIIATPLLEEGRLVRVLPEWQDQSRSIAMLYPHRKYVPKRVRCFIDFMLQRLQEIFTVGPPSQ